MECPILPVGAAVGSFLPVPTGVAQAIRQALLNKGYADPGDDRYGPAMAQELARFQRDHPTKTAGDQLIGQAIGAQYAFASCATFFALGLNCTRVYWDVGIWEPILGQGAAFAAGAALALAADRGVVNLSCPGSSPSGGGTTTPTEGGTSPVVWLIAIGAGLWLVKRRREA